MHPERQTSLPLPRHPFQPNITSRGLAPSKWVAWGSENFLLALVACCSPEHSWAEIESSWHEDHLKRITWHVRRLSLTAWRHAPHSCCHLSESNSVRRSFKGTLLPNLRLHGPAFTQDFLVALCHSFFAKVWQAFLHLCSSCNTVNNLSVYVCQGCSRQVRAIVNYGFPI